MTNQTRDLLSLEMQTMLGWIDRNLFWAAAVLFLGSAIPMAFVVGDQTHGDVRLYHRVENGVRRHIMPYRDQALEYPPYAIPIFLVPGLFGDDIADYQFGFAVSVAFADAILTGLWFLAAFKENYRVRGLLR